MAEDEIDEGSKLPPDARLESLDKRLDIVQRREARKAGKKLPDASYRAGQAVLSNLVGAPVGGFIIGFALDRWWGTKPWAMLAMLFAGFAVGIWNVFRIAKNPSGRRPDA